MVLERATRVELREGEPASCVAEFENGRPIEARGETAREALLRAFVASRFGETVGEMLRQPQVLIGMGMEPAAEPSAIGDVEDLPHPGAQIGDIGTPPR